MGYLIQKTFLLKKQWLYVTYSKGDKWEHIFSVVISSKANVKVQQKFELAFFEATL